MDANTKELKNRINRLRLPWWFNLVKLGIPYTVGVVTAVTIMLALGGWIAMPVAVPLLQWVEALFLAMQPAVRVIAVSLVGLGSFLSSQAITSVIVRGFLFPLSERSALEGLETGAQLWAQVKELKANLVIQTNLYEQNQEQLEFLKGFSTAAALNRNAGHKVEPKKESKSESDLDFESDQEENFLPDSEGRPLSASTVIFRKSPSKPALVSFPQREGLSEETDKQDKDKIAFKA